MRSDWHNGHRALGVAQGASVVLSGVVGGLLKTEPSKWVSFPTAANGVVWIQGNSYWLIGLLAILVPLLHAWKQHMGSPYYLWGVIKYLLDEMHKDVFRNNEEASHHERVTLFKFQKFAFKLRANPWSGWLLPVERSGKITRRSRACYLATDDGYKSEGVAGRAWASGKTILAPNLPQIGLGSSEAELKNYADKTFMGLKEVKKRLKNGSGFPRSLCAIPIEVKGKNWGVIVIDSTEEELVQVKEINKFYGKHAGVLNKLLEKV